MSNHYQTVSKQTIMAIVAIALIGFSGILSETSMNVTFPTLMSVYQLPLHSRKMCGKDPSFLWPQVSLPLGPSWPC